jgi:hypothetical protein
MGFLDQAQFEKDLKTVYESYESSQWHHVIDWEKILSYPIMTPETNENGKRSLSI